MLSPLSFSLAAVVIFLVMTLIIAALKRSVHLSVYLLKITARARVFYNSITRAEYRLTADYLNYQKQLKEKRRSLEEVSRQSRQLEVLASDRFKKAYKRERRKLKPSSEKMPKQMTKAQLTRTERLKQKISIQKQNAHLLQLEINEIEKLVHLTLAKRDLLAAERKGFVSTQNRLEHAITINLARASTFIAKLDLMEQDTSTIDAVKAIKPGSLNRTIKALESFEADVLKHEALADKNQTTTKLTSLSTEEGKFIELAVGRLQKNIDFLDLNVRKLHSLFTSTDPDLERAYERMLTQIALARELFARSVEEELVIEKLLVLPVPEDESKALKSALRTLRVRNILVDQQLYKVECVVRRLFVIKLLLAANPSNIEAESSTFKSILERFSNSMENFWKTETAKIDAEKTDSLAPALADLETKLQNGLLALTKKSSKDDQSRESKDCFLKRIPEIRKVIEMELEDQIKDFHNWESINSQAIKDKTEMLRLIASQRTEFGGKVVNALERSLEILSTTEVALRAQCS